MKVHICWLHPHGEKIVDRLMQTLASETGWTLSTRPDPGADLNYFGLYVDFAQRFSDWNATPLAAYFSHLEPDTPYKKFWWDAAEPLIDIKTVTATQYGEMLSGQTIRVVPPVDRDIFTIKPRDDHDKPVLGTSGFIAPGGRKGEKLLARLAGDMDGKADVVASGQGWPVRKINGSLKGLTDYYNSLDVYVCTSLIEGIPMPPLEALTCGIPIIIPRGVGMLDDLPDAPGIYRYPVGDYNALLSVAQRALKSVGKENREKLREITAGYTAKAWATSHVRGFEKAMIGKKVRVKKPESSRHGKRGVYYVAYGKPARDCARGSMASFKTHMPDVEIALASSNKLGGEDIFINHPDEDIGGRAAKVQINDLVPKDWEYIMYLDADTEVIADISFLYQVLEDGWDMVICKNPARFHVAREMKRGDNNDECEVTFRQIGTDELIQLNAGVFAYQRNDRTKAFFDAWHREWKRYGKRDQAALLRALFNYPLKLYVLGNEWNTITRYDSPDISAGVLHYPMTARRWRGKIAGRSDGKEAWQAVKDFEKS